MHPKTSQAVLSRKKEGSEGSYTSEEAKFTRERCIRVAAIVIMITPGVSNICGVEKKREIKSLPSENQRLQRNIRRVMDLIFGTESSPMISYHRYMGEGQIPFKCNNVSTYDVNGI